MPLDRLLLALLAVAALLWLGGAVRRILLWRRGRAATVPLVRGLLALPKRYLVDLHRVVARDRAIARAHIATAGGFLVSGLLVLAVHVVPGGGVATAWALLAALGVMYLGIFFVAWRRHGEAPARLSLGAWSRLPAALAALAFALAVLTLPPAGYGVEDTWTFAVPILLGIMLAWGLGEVVVGMTWGGPMTHAFAGALHLAFHPRPGRFAGEAATALLPLDLDEARLGVATPADFAWNRLLGFDACVQCGRCEAACPAFAAGQPLNPKKLVRDLVVGFAGPGDDRRYAGSPHPGRPVGGARGAPEAAIVPGLIAPETIWACTTCRACVDACPMFIEHVDAIVDLRRCLTLEQGAVMGKGAELLEELRATDNPGGFDPSRRAEWTVGHEVPVLAEGDATEVLFWVGDAAFERRAHATLLAVVKLLRAAGVDFAILGAAELDCGDVARRLGDEATFQDLARRNIATLARRRFARIITADPHALHCLGREYPAFGGRYDVVHHTTYLAELVAQGRLAIAPLPARRVTYHDPCYLGRYGGEVAAPRELLTAMGLELVEMTRSGLDARCCGGGGGAPATDVPGPRRIPDMRMADARETGSELLAVACPNCMTMLEGVVGPGPEVRDVAELMAEALSP